MHFASILLLAGVASASLFTRQSIPECALTCISQADLGDCSATDNACLCSNEAFVQGTAACIQSTCTGDDLENAIALSEATCEDAGVTLTDTDLGGTSTATDASASGSETASGTATETSTGTGTSTADAADSSEDTNAAKQNGVPALAAAALGLAAFIL